jgi:hypothetical protein
MTAKSGLTKDYDIEQSTTNVIQNKANQTQFVFLLSCSSFDGNSNPAWSSDIEQRKAVFIFPGGCNRIDVTYNAPLKRYLLVTHSRARIALKLPQE